MASTEDTALFRDVFQANPDPIMIHDADTGIVVRANEAAGALLGRPPADIVGMHVGEFSPPGFSTADANALITEAATSGSAQVEWTTRGPDGESRRVEVSLERAVIGDTTRVVAFIHDVTEIRQQERKHTERSKQLQTLMENLPVVVFTLDPDGVFTYSAGKGLDGLGIEPGELEGIPVYEVYKQYPEIIEAVEQALDGEEVRVTQEVNDLVFETWYRPVFDNDGDLTQVVSVARDITDLKRREARIETLSEATNELLYTRTERAVADTVTQIAQHIIDQPLAAMWSYNSDDDTLYPIGATSEAADFAAVETASDLSPMGPESDENRLFHDGSPTVVEDYQALSNPSAPQAPLRTVLFLPLEDYGMLCIGSPTVESFDSHERFLLEILASTGAAALNRVERETRLKSKQAELERSNEALQQFAYIASHDLQEPLRMVSSYVDLLDSEYGDDLDDEAAEYMAFAVDGARRMQEMVNALLRYSRVETNSGDFEETDPEAVLDRTLDALRMRIEEVDATITAESLPPVEADPNQVGQVFQNLLDNAIEYAVEAGIEPRIEVSADRDDDDVVFTVSDNGPGIPAADHEEVFDIFHRAGAHDTDGTGIGLAVCQRIVLRHDGRIWVEPSDNGAMFKFTLPAVTEVSGDD
ncbi:sensory transduction histidine kinase [Haloarcula marismortui ATCC 43049]|uniref:histidine kinase n=1 Tax=Haloarcula marismortui (strain ATCC 43049 / DSM 3752 / JCM 8966 / VKM B-1809) TaxID=272569 RepID=Q5V4V7_HALMA|nr:ATP-binding protein [Haloarcula marismortui]AAV45445.1 sensory transduction histidine kinase [Haloarcula marismortui ATCC 43049]QCP93216.1 PAS domain S-box protein [Haloarcula marismortui ATCC 43049]